MIKSSTYGAERVKTTMSMDELILLKTSLISFIGTALHFTSIDLSDRNDSASQVQGEIGAFLLLRSSRYDPHVNGAHGHKGFQIQDRGLLIDGYISAIYANIC